MAAVNDHSKTCRCVVCQLARAVEGATEDEDRQAQVEMTKMFEAMNEQESR